MINALLDALSMPGDYTRGLLAGRLLERVTPGELSEAWGLGDADTPLAWLRDFGLGMATDPLLVAGGALGGVAARGAYRALGPLYGGGAEKLAGMRALEGNPAFMAARLLEAPEGRAILKEIPPGSVYLEGGLNAIPFRTPRGDVVRISKDYESARAAIPEMLQPTRSVAYGPYRVERVPWAERVGDYDHYLDVADNLQDAALARGFRPVDVHEGNIGSYRGRPVFIDPGAVEGPSEFRHLVGPTPGRFWGPGVGLGSAAGGGLALLRQLEGRDAR